MKKILVLEDEENIRSFVVINLKRAGYETVEAGTGEEALAQLKQNPGIRVALLDIMLPDIDGFEVCRRIRAMDNKIGIITPCTIASPMPATGPIRPIFVVLISSSSTSFPSAFCSSRPVVIPKIRLPTCISVLCISVCL